MRTSILGRTGLSVTPLCVGTSPLGNFPAQYGYEVGAEQAVATITRALEGPINFIDTSNNYGNGDSERRIGVALARTGGLPDGFVLATKVDPLPGSSDFSGQRVRASVRESLERLGLDRLQLVYLHDPERMTFADATAPGGAIEALIALREEGVIGSIGVAGGPIDVELQYLALDVFDVVISHNRYTLVDSSAEPLLAAAAERGVAFVNAAPYGGGMLVRGPAKVPTYAYQPTDNATLTRVSKIEQICEDNGVPLPAAALQFSMRDPRITSTIVGMSSPHRIDETLRFAEHSISQDLWAELEPLTAQGRAGVGI